MAYPHTLLLVEDDPADARLIMRAMEKAQIPARVVRVQDGDQAVAYLSNEPPYEDRKVNPLPKVVIMDIKLPRRSGLEVLRWMRQQTFGPRSVPVIMLTSSYHAVDIARAYEYGVNSYLVKPETSEQLLSMLMMLRSYWFSYNKGPSLDEVPLTSPANTEFI